MIRNIIIATIAAVSSISFADEVNLNAEQLSELNSIEILIDGIETRIDEANAKAKECTGNLFIFNKLLAKAKAEKRTEDVEMLQRVIELHKQLLNEYISLNCRYNKYAAECSEHVSCIQCGVDEHKYASRKSNIRWSETCIAESWDKIDKYNKELETYTLKLRKLVADLIK